MCCSKINGVDNNITDWIRVKMGLVLCKYECSINSIDHTNSFIYLFGAYVAFNTVQVISQWVVGNQYIQFVRVLYCKLPTNCKNLPAFPLEAVPGT